jgi:hypothetical protein
MKSLREKLDKIIIKNILSDEDKNNVLNSVLSTLRSEIEGMRCNPTLEANKKDKLIIGFNKGLDTVLRALK